MKSLPENLLEVLRFREFEQYAGRRLRQAEAAPEVELVADIGGLVQGEVVRGGEEEGA